MKVFVRTVELGNFSAAAAALQLSPTMVGKHVSSLESHLRTRLLHRTTRRQGLTPAGRIFFEQCRAILADVELAEASVNELHSVPRGKLRISAPLYFGIHSLAPALGDFLRSSPEVEVDLVLSDQVPDLLGGGFEAAFRLGTIEEQDLIAVPLAPFSLTLCAAPSYLAERGMPGCPADLVGHECFGCTPSGPASEFVFHGPNGAERTPIHGRCQINDCQALRRIALEGLGVVQLAEVLVTEDVSNGRLAKILPEYQSPSRPMHLVYMPDRRPTTKLRAFVEFARKRFSI
jgi:DNA-binding transcriptional LysR family regulator